MSKWKATMAEEGYAYVLDAVTEDCIASVGRGQNLPEQAKAQARLMAAAPDLAMHLRRALDVMDADMQETRSSTRWSDMWECLEAAEGKPYVTPAMSSAAPDLLNACRAVLCTDMGRNADMEALKHQLEEAVNKAEGKE